MAFYENKICPVCKKEFEAADDIVVCPECGTPHHRDCYNLVGHCVNKGLHKSGYDYYKEQKEAPSQDNAFIEENPQRSGEYYIPIIGEASPEKDNDNEKPLNPPDIFRYTEEDTVYERDTQTIGGESVADFAAAIGRNAPRFINIFKAMEATNKKTSWNWCAFFFGSIYLLTRKIYKQGVAFLCLALSAVFGSVALIMKFAPQYVSAVKEIYANALASKASAITPEDIAVLSKACDIKNAAIIVYALVGVFIIFRIIQALFADSFYKEKVLSIIKSVKDSFEDATIIPNPLGSNTEMTKDQFRRMVLARKGGISLFVPFFVIWALVMILF